MGEITLDPDAEVTHVEETPTSQERRAVRAELAEQLVSAFASRIASKKTWIAKPNRDKWYALIRSAPSVPLLAMRLAQLCEEAASATISKHLAKIANDPNSIKAFCPRCGRAYRHHSRTTGECPINPFEDDEGETPQS